ncbi:MAG: HD domain-containing protein [Selenomonas sp.]|nr:HD domain-containing protein [Selenomonas sp.]
MKQFYRAITARITPADRQWVAENLSTEAQVLFYAMHPADQYHALHVAKTALALWAQHPAGDRSLLLRAALLHDVGRVQGDMDIWGKVLAVLLKHFLPEWSRHLGSLPEGWLGHILYVYYHHPEIGALKLEKIGLASEAALVRRHHTPAEEKEPPELALLRAADELN